MYNWDDYLNEVVGVYNETVHASTGVTPYQLLTGHEKSTPLGFYFPEFLPRKFRNEHDYVNETIQRQQQMHQLVRHNTKQAQRRQKNTLIDV